MSGPPSQEIAPPAPVPDAALPPPPELVGALAYFDRGDFASTRSEIAAGLAARPNPELQAAARDLLDRMAPDPWALRLGLAALVILLMACNQYLR